VIPKRIERSVRQGPKHRRCDDNPRSPSTAPPFPVGIVAHAVILATATASRTKPPASSHSVWLTAVTRRRELTDFHGLDQAVFDGESVADVFITKNDPVQVAHDLMHIDQDSASTLWMERNRLDLRVNLGPLLRPVSSHFMMTAYEAPLKRPRPCHVRRHFGEGGVEVSRVNAAYAARSSSTSGKG